MNLIYFTFHGVGTVPRSIDAGEHHCWLERDYFERVLDLLHGHPHIRVTIDDGNASDHEIILPALLNRGMTATFFVCSDRLDQPTFLSSAQVRDLKSHGMGIGSHGAAHRPWRRLEPADLQHELVDSRHALEDLCVGKVDEAACPFGSYGRHALSSLRNAGYSAVYTSDGGGASTKQWLRARTTVTRSLSLETVRHLVEHGSSGFIQAIINVRKSIKRLRS